MQLYRNLIIVQILLLLSTSVINGQNLIDNPGFENGTTGWTLYENNGGSANLSTESLNSPEGSLHLKCDVLSLGSDDWNVQLKSNEFAVDENHQYRLTFKAKSDNPGSNVKVYIQKNAWMGKDFTLSDSWTSYSYEFFPNESTKELKFNFVNVDKYYIDDILIEDVTKYSDFNTPPSCVITAPHVNAYFKEGSVVRVNAYATDIGGSGIPGEISKVEFFIDKEKIGESSTAENNTYSFEWNADNSGEFLIEARATDTLDKSFTAAGVVIRVGTSNAEVVGLSSGKGKYLGNVVGSSGFEPAFLEYWNAVTSGNGGKWQTVESTRDQMNWNSADVAYNLSRMNNLPYRYHTLAWGSQYPSWIKNLGPAEFQEEMEEFIKAIADRYPKIDQIDVLNEALPGHQEDTRYFIIGLGGGGESGYDWAVWLFKKAREYFPNSKLILNDFAIVNSSSNIREQLLLFKVLRDSALVDGFGAQAHTFNLDGMQAADLKKNLDIMAGAGVPIYITEMDMKGVNSDQSSQLSSYQNLFPVLWEHPAVAGITLWGYIYGAMWQPEAGLINESGTERTSMVWLKNYLKAQNDLGYPFANASASSAPEISVSKPHIKLYPNPSKGIVTLSNESAQTENISIYTIYGAEVDEFELNSNSKEVLNLSAGMYLVKTNKKESIKLLVID